MANADTIIHTCSQFRITIYSYLNVFGLGEESGIVGENLCRPRKNAQTWFEPRTFLMWGTSANHWLTMLHCVLWALRLAYKKLLIENKQTNKQTNPISACGTFCQCDVWKTTQGHVSTLLVHDALLTEFTS